MTLQVDILTLNTDHRGRVVSVVVSGAGPTASPGLRDTFRTKVSSHWRRHGHVIAVLISDWSRSWWRAQSRGQRRTQPPSSRGWRRRRRGRRGARWEIVYTRSEKFYSHLPHVQVPDNRSFLAKYWMYIVPVVLFMAINGAAAPEGS